MQPIIKDNYLPLSYIDGIEARSTGEFITWTLKNDITSSSDNYGYLRKKGFSHAVYTENYHTPLFYYLIPFFEEITNELKFKNTELLRIKLGLNIPNTFECKADTPHVDFILPHYTMLYYVNSSDGPTNMYNQFYSLQNKIPNPNTFKIVQQIEPKKGRFVIFNGLQYHSSSTPLNDVRLAINFNFKADLEPTN